MGKSAGSQTQKTSNEPWKELQPYLKEGYQRASDQYAPGQGPQYYPGQTYAPTDPLTQESRAMTEYYARNQMPSDIGAVRDAYGNMLNSSQQFMNNDLLTDKTLQNNPLMNPNLLMQAFNPNNPYTQFIGNNKLLGAIDIDNNPYFGNAVNAAIRPITEQLTEQALPAIRSGAVQTGQYGGSRQALAEGTAIGKAAQAMGDTAGTMASNAYGQGLNAYNQGLGAVQNLYSQNIGAYDQGLGRLAQGYGLYGQGQSLYGSGIDKAAIGADVASNAISQAPGMLQLSQMPAQTLGQLGSAYESDTQKVIDSAGQRFGYNQTLPYNMLSDYMSLLNGNNFGTSTTKQTGSSGGSDIMGGLGAAISLASMFSDKRIKEDIKRVGTTDSGLPVYTYRYKWGGPMQMGVMAQDVEKVNPEAVSEVNGIKMVNYGMIQ